MNRKDLVVLAADKNIEYALKGIVYEAASTGYSVPIESGHFYSSTT